MRKTLRRILSTILVVAMVFGLAGETLAASSGVSPSGSISVSPATRDAYFNAMSSLGMPGIHGFDGNDALPDDESPVSVIVLFNHQPAATLQAEAAIEYGTFMSRGVAEVLAESDHVSFRQELDGLFGTQRSRTGSAYQITSEYRLALNGVAITLPADRVTELAEFSSVYAVYPNSAVYLDPFEKENVETVLLGNEAGNAAGREAMNVDELHGDHIKGDDTTVCIIDTGIDYNHPDFAGAFGTSNPAGTTTEADLIGGTFYGRNFINDGYVTRAANNPMETTYADWEAARDANESPESDALGRDFYTTHGTHVSGTVAARGTNNPGDGDATSALGVAPEATIFVYRVFGTYSTSSVNSILDAIEYTAIDEPDVVNMSLGANTNSPFYVYSLAVNNVMIGNDKILFVVSAANSGPGMFTLSSPGTAPSALTVANATVDRTRTKVTVSINYEDEGGGPSIGHSSAGIGGGTTSDDEVDEVVPTDEATPGDETQGVTPEGDETAGGETTDATAEGDETDNVATEGDETDNVATEGDETDNVATEGDETADAETFNAGGTYAAAAKKDFDLGIFYMHKEDWAKDMSGDGLSCFKIDYSGITPEFDRTDMQNIKIMYNILPMPNISGVEGSSDLLGVGTREEFEALDGEGGGAIAGKVLLLRRGGNFVETLEYAKEFGAGAIIMINRNPAVGSTDGLDDFRGYSENYLPFFTIEDYETGVDFAEACADGGNALTVKAVTEYLDKAHLSYSSSRGPVSATYDIKPDVASHGTGVLSTVPLGAGDTDYTDAYALYSGTSMSAPHVAGAAALLRSANPDWTSEEIKIRLMNTATPLGPYENGSSTTHYGVYEQGAGFVDVKAALDAESIVYVQSAMEVNTNEDYTETETKYGKTGSFSFGLIDVMADSGEGATLYQMTGTINNQSESNKTYNLSSVFNTGGQLVKNPTSLTDGAFMMMAFNLTGSAATVEVDAGESETFTVYLMVSDALGAQNSGSYEGYITVDDNEGDTYSIPFAAYASVKAEPLLDGDFFPNRPVISSGEFAQTKYSGNMDFTFKPSKGSFMSFYVLDPDKSEEYKTEGSSSVDINKVFESQALIGDLYYSYDATQRALGDWALVENIITDGGYYPYTAWADDGIPSEMSTSKKHFDEGIATIMVQAITMEYEYYYYFFDIYVDNTAPEITVTALDTDGDYNSLVFTPNTPLTISGTVYDEAIDEMLANDLKFSIWEPSDPYPSTPSQVYTALYAYVDGEYTKVTVNSDGNFSFTLPAKADPYDVTLYAVDGFSILFFDYSEAMGFGARSSATVHRGFNPNEPSNRLVDSGNVYGFVGSNLKILPFRVEESGPRMIVRPDSVDMYAGQTVNQTALFNGDALGAGDVLSTVTVSDTSIASVTRSGNTFILRALLEGTTDVIATSKNGLSVTVPVNVNVLNGDGVSLEADDKVYYGAMNHIEDFQIVSYYGIEIPVKTFEQAEQPILWNVMGNERYSDDTYGNLTLLSEHVLDVDQYSFAPSALYVAQVQDDGKSFGSIRNYLNGGMRVVFDMNAPEGASFTEESEMMKNFTDIELENVPAVKNEIPYYNTEVLMQQYSTVSDGDKFFLPWAAAYVGLKPWSVFWSAGADFEEDNSLAFREDTPDLTATLKNGTEYGYWTETMSGSEWYVFVVNDDGAMDYLAANKFAGVRPAMTLDMNSIVYAQELEDGVYKLTVSGGSASLEGDVTSPAQRTLAHGTNLAVSGSVTGDYDHVAYKIVKDGSIVGYGELEKEAIAGGALTFDTDTLASGDYKIYVWPQTNDELHSNVAGEVFVLNTTVSAPIVTPTPTPTPRPPSDNNNSGNTTSTATPAPTAAPTQAPAQTPPPPAPVQQVAEVDLTTGAAKSEVKAEELAAAIKQVQENNVPNQAITIVATVPDDVPAEGLKTVTVSIEQTAADSIAKESTASVNIQTPIGIVSFDNKALETIVNDGGEGDMTLVVATVDTKALAESGQLKQNDLDKIGDRPVYEFTVSKGDTEVSNFKGGKATINIPYELQPGENPNAIVVYYIDAEGKLKTMRGSYDADTGTVSVVTTHFSKYAIGYNPVSFNDVDDEWFAEPVMFIAARDITGGVGGGNYAPDGIVTRGQFITMLLRAYHIDPLTGDNFADAGDTWYTGYLAAAKQMGISNGVGDNKFAPEQEINREEMLSLLYNTLSAIEELPNGAGKSLSDFDDSGDASSWAADAVKCLVENGIVSGSNGKLDLKGKSTRAQVAQLLYNLLAR